MKFLDNLLGKTSQPAVNPARTGTITKVEQQPPRQASTTRPEQGQLGGLMNKSRTSSGKNASQGLRPSTSPGPSRLYDSSNHQLGDFRDIRRPLTAPDQKTTEPEPTTPTAKARPKKLPRPPVQEQPVPPRSEWAGEPMSLAEMNALPRFRNLMGRPLAPDHVGRFQFESQRPGQLDGLGVSDSDSSHRGSETDSSFRGSDTASSRYDSDEDFSPPASIRHPSVSEESLTGSSDFSEPSVDARRPMTAPEMQASTSASAMAKAPLKPALKTSTSAPLERPKTGLLSRWAEKKMPFSLFSKADKPTPGASTSKAKGTVRFQPTPESSESASSHRSEAFVPSFKPRQFADDDSLRGMTDTREQKFFPETSHSPAPSDDGIPEIPDERS